MSSTIQHQEHFRYNPRFNAWTCLRCSDARQDQLEHNAAAHERTQKHAQAVSQYSISQQAANIYDREEFLQAASGIVGGDSLSDPTIDALMTGFMAQTGPSSFSSRHHDQYASQHTPPEPSINLHFQSTSQHIPHTAEQQLQEEVADIFKRYAVHMAQVDDRSSDEGGGEMPESSVVLESQVQEPEYSTTTQAAEAGPSISATQRGPWAPWGDRMSCTMDIITHLTRSSYSDADVETMAWLLKANGVPDVPSTSKMKKTYRALDQAHGPKVRRYTGAFGHTYYIVDLADQIAMDMANPKVRPFLEFFPEDLGNRLEEARQAEQWLRRVDNQYLSPMHRINGLDFYIHEVARLTNGEYCIPFRWFKRDRTMWCQAWRLSLVVTSNETGWVVERWDVLVLPETDFKYAAAQLERVYLGRGIPSLHHIIGHRSDQRATLEEWTHPYFNPWRVKAKGKRVVTVPIWLYCDDTSGNRTKKWNEHNSFLFIPAGLPREHAHREYNIHFLCTSNTAPPLEMMDGVVSQIEELQEHGTVAFDCVLGEEVLVTTFVLALLGDNPMQSEFACHAGLRAKFFCRCCWVKGKDAGDMVNVNGKKKETLSGMIKRVKDFIKIGRMREAKETRDTSVNMFDNMVELAPLSKNQDLQTASGVKDGFLRHFLSKLETARKNASRRGQGMDRAVNNALSDMPDNIYSPVWRLKELSPHTATPVEILHVILLGFLKYFWRDAMDRLSESQKETVKHRLSSVDVRGLDPSVSALRGHTLVQYSGSLVGRDFRILGQVAIFVLYDLLPDALLETWVALISLIPFIWQPRIVNIDEYIADLTKRINHFLQCTARWSPRWFNKPKFHLILHILAHIRLFGPAISFATEVFEAFNAIIRNWCIHSNRQAPSYDTACQAAGCARVRHLASGGFYREIEDAEQPQEEDSGHGRWRQVSDTVLGLLEPLSVISHRMGLIPKAVVEVGYTSAKAQGKMLWNQTQAASKSIPNPLSSEPFFYTCPTVVVANGDTLVVGANKSEDLSFCIAKHCDSGLLLLGRLVEILGTSGALWTREANFVILQSCQLGNAVSPYGMPAVTLQDEYLILEPKDVMCSVNVQHNCAANSCSLSGQRRVRQEREETEITIPAIHHNNPTDLILNTGKMRDAYYIQQFATPPSEIENIDAIIEAACTEELNVEGDDEI